MTTWTLQAHWQRYGNHWASLGASPRSLRGLWKSNSYPVFICFYAPIILNCFEFAPNRRRLVLIKIVIFWFTLNSNHHFWLWNPWRSHLIIEAKNAGEQVQGLTSQAYRRVRVKKKNSGLVMGLQGLIGLNVVLWCFMLHNMMILWWFYTIFCWSMRVWNW